MSSIRMIVAIILLCILVTVGCNNPFKNQPIISIDTLNNNVKDSPVLPPNEEEPEPDPKTILFDQLKSYDKKQIIDTSYESGKDKFHLHLEHYCLFDSSITIPKIYVAFYGLDSFVTHAFEAKILLQKNGVEILNSIIRKENFDNLSNFTSLAQYGALLYPEVRLTNEIAEIGFSISIPLTDIGIQVMVKMDNNGKLTYETR